jgi:hypothetical protein
MNSPTAMVSDKRNTVVEDDQLRADELERKRCDDLFSLRFPREFCLLDSQTVDICFRQRGDLWIVIKAKRLIVTWTKGRCCLFEEECADEDKIVFRNSRLSSPRTVRIFPSIHSL